MNAFHCRCFSVHTDVIERVFLIRRLRFRCVCAAPDSGSARPAWRVACPEFLPSQSTESCRPPAALTSCTLSENKHTCHVSVCPHPPHPPTRFTVSGTPHGRRPPHLALQLRNTPGELRVGGLWQLRVEALRETPHPVLPVLVLQAETHRPSSVRT